MIRVPNKPAEYPGLVRGCRLAHRHISCWCPFGKILQRQAVPRFFSSAARSDDQACLQRDGYSTVMLFLKMCLGRPQRLQRKGLVGFRRANLAYVSLMPLRRLEFLRPWREALKWEHHLEYGCGVAEVNG
jgi:hypothetical protein